MSFRGGLDIPLTMYNVVMLYFVSNSIVLFYILYCGPAVGDKGNLMKINPWRYSTIYYEQAP